MMTNPQDRPEARKQPNIILIMVDDMGFSDIGCYGSEIRTPNLDRLAAEGTRFTQMYNCARCCPTRASLLTGLYPHQAGVGHMVGNYGHPSYQGFLSDRAVTIGEALQGAGYRTLMAGKWHVGGQSQPEAFEPGRPSPGHPIPVQRGFDRHYGTLGGGGSYFDPPTLIRDYTRIRAEGDDYYYTDAISQNAVAMMRDAAGDGQPFFLYVAYTAPHWPLHAFPEDIARYEGAYRGGWEALRASRHETLKSLGLVNPKWPISPRDAQAPPWAEAPHKEWQELRMAVYAAQVDRMDQGVGRILAALRELGLEQDTLVMFLSDNGGCAEFLAEDGGRGNLKQYDVPTRDGRPMRIGNSPAIQPGPADTFQSYDLPWANASNTPFRLYKHWVHEGGIATPLIARWPAAIPAGGLVHSPAHVMDLMATCLDAAGAAYPAEYNGNPIQPLEGESLLPAFRGQTWARRREIFWEHEGNRAVRQGQWKLVSKYPGNWELYDMDADRTELNDLSEKNAPKAKELEGLYNEWAARCAVLPWDELQAMRRR